MKVKLDGYWNRDDGRGRNEVFVPTSTFDFTIATTGASEVYSSGLYVDTGGSITIDWGDTTIETVTTVGTLSHTYVTPSTYTIKVSEFLLCDMWFSSDTNVVDILTSIPSGFTWSSGFYLRYLFQDSTVKTVPSEMFKNIVGQLDISGTTLDLIRMFDGSSITTIPDDFLLFNEADFSTSVDEIDARYMFIDCTSLTSIGDSILDHITFTTFSCAEMFSGCSNLTTVGNVLKDANYTCDTFEMFYNCSSLSSIPSDLLYSNTGLTSAISMLQGCTSLTSYPIGFLDNIANLVNVSSMFYGCTGMTNAADDLWNDAQYTSYSSCFYNCTNLTNYASIPTAWK